MKLSPMFLALRTMMPMATSLPGLYTETRAAARLAMQYDGYRRGWEHIR